MFLLISPRNEKYYYLPNSASSTSAGLGLAKLQLGAFNLITTEFKDLKNYSNLQGGFWLNWYLMLRMRYLMLLFGLNCKYSTMCTCGYFTLNIKKADCCGEANLIK